MAVENSPNYDYIANIHSLLRQAVPFGVSSPDLQEFLSLRGTYEFIYQYFISVNDILVPSAIQRMYTSRLIDRRNGSIAVDGFGRIILVVPDDQIDFEPRVDEVNRLSFISVSEYENSTALRDKYELDIPGAGGASVIYRSGSLFEIARAAPGRAPAAFSGGLVSLPGSSGVLVQSFDDRLAIDFTALPQITDGAGTFFTNGLTTSIASVSPSVYILDFVLTSTSMTPELRARGFVEGERFFLIGGQAIGGPSGGSLPGRQSDEVVAPGTLMRFAISDGLNPLNPNGLTNIGLPGGFRTDCSAGDGRCSIAAQFLTPDPALGRPIAFSRFNAFRPEETFVAGAPRGDTHLLVVAGENNRHPAMRFDLQIAADGRSSAGVSTGGLLALPFDGGLALSGNTVGSARLGAGGSLAVTGNFGSLATAADGYGGHMFQNSDPTDRGGGLIGHFAIGESDPRPGPAGRVPDPNSPGSFLPPVQPGSVQAVGGGGSVPFGFTRLATNVGSVTPSAGRGPLGGVRADGVTPAGLDGFAAGLVETPAGTGGAVNLYAGVGARLGDVRITSRNGDREITASIRVSSAAAGEIPVAGTATPAVAGRADRTLTFGADAPNGVPTTAMASRSTFAAVIPRQAGMASVNEDVLPGIRRPDGTQSAMPASNEHLAWGVFMGDLVANASGAQREFMGLGFWVAGRPVDYGTLQALTGTATYRGGMVGNVVSAQGARTVAGDFTHAYDFGRRSGTLSANFDGASYAARTGTNGTNVFSGQGPGQGAAANRVMSVSGAFFHNPTTAGPVSSANLPRATGGVFGIAGPGYGANGVFVGTRQ
ncbi:hypothetical protein [Neoroseomonas rubea]|uniref:hypothetical protein n=1 Tax=Neoroseomonas rubea TaxID=2748666 RepID=UPI0018DF380B|nr:hypothetical protein [Roseomonas rubea]